MTKKALIIIPCFNEEQSIAILLGELSMIDFSGHYDVNVIVVNDGSIDKTAEVVSQFDIILLDLTVNLGIGGAVQTGFKYALENDFDVAIQVDGDGQHPPAEIQKLLNVYHETKSNIVIGSRFITKRGFQSSALRRFGIFYLHWLNKVFTKKNIYDITSGFRLFDKKAIALAARYYPDEYPEPESLVIFAKAGFSIAETPVMMKPRQGGQSSIRYFSQMYYMIKVTIAMFFSYIRKVK
ncbi:glycosyltransferase family 2 protein [Lacihabitans sp. CS3-21]|uniref:glycosyltransferase family 2 protein n=1 Tax=Lacihabitans sp. CS3-21 TaxID=2487332 RepID=UPI0020CF83B2|nr:glycosyltransferase family 2 protein [Lacihabitans sp. CS3-21]MCP9748231.1 glycosyltransferase family 2 protein [Lacihabitans sp. CS3-21]